VAIACSSGLLSGCAGYPAPRVRLDPGVVRPRRAAVLMTVDGLAADKFEQFLAAGDLPHIQRLLVDRGVRVRRAVTSQPCVTYANLTTLLTGRYPSHHGVLGNKWFDRYARVHRDYTTMATYRLVDQDCPAPTLFERLAPQPGASIQCACRRGASRPIDNWASSGIRWFFGALEDVDRLVPLRMELVAEHANQRGCWPTLIHAYFPAVDEIGHRLGCDSPEYRRAVINVDEQISRLGRAVEAAGMADATYFVLVSDHGHVPVPPDRFFDVAGYLRRTAGLVVRDTAVDAGPEADFARRCEHYAQVDAVVSVSGDRQAVVHLRRAGAGHVAALGAWSERPSFTQIERLLGMPVKNRTRENGEDREDSISASSVPSGSMNPSAAPAPVPMERGSGGQALWQQPAIDFVLAPRTGDDGQRNVEVWSKSGHSRLGRRRKGSVLEYGYETVEGDALAGAIEPGWHDSQAWLALTANGPFPDFVVQMFEQFDSPRAGDLVLLAAPGWDFAAGGRGGHGGTRAREMLIPLVLAGPDLPAGGEIGCARLADVAPTLLGLLGAGDHPHGPASFDGVDRSAELRAVRSPRNDPR